MNTPTDLVDLILDKVEPAPPEKTPRPGYRVEMVELREGQWAILEREAKAQNMSLPDLIYRSVARSLSQR